MRGKPKKVARRKGDAVELRGERLDNESGDRKKPSIRGINDRANPRRRQKKIIIPLISTETFLSHGLF